MGTGVAEETSFAEAKVSPALPKYYSFRFVKEIKAMADNVTSIGSQTDSSSISSPGNGGFGHANATSLSQTAQEYAGKVSEAAVQAKDYVNDTVNLVGEKIKD